MLHILGFTVVWQASRVRETIRPPPSEAVIWLDVPALSAEIQSSRHAPDLASAPSVGHVPVGSTLTGSVKSTGADSVAMPDAGGEEVPALTLSLSSQQLSHEPTTADMARQQLSTDRPTDALAKSVGDASVRDCLRNPDGRVGGLLALPGLFYDAATGKCR